MTIAIMQPYLFPYLGYYQLAAASDLMVVYDDVAYSSGGWINRNRLLDPGGGEPFWFTVPVRPARLGCRIDEVEIGGRARWSEKLLRRIEAAYRGAPQFAHIWPLVESTLANPETNLARFLVASMRASFELLGIDTELVEASGRYDNQDLPGAERLVDIARREGATVYLNPEGGDELYRPEEFAAAGVTLAFLRHRPLPYPQAGDTFVPRLSIIDALMHNDPDAMAGLLAAYEIENAN